jgi:uncharacterized protein involved in exopolysaccharide biosynthesis
VTLSLVIGLTLTAGAVLYFPRTYTCKTVLMGFGSPVLDGTNAQNPLAGADGLILRHENLEAIIRETDLVHKFDSRRSALLKLKDRVMAALRGEPSEKDKIGALVGTLESKLTVTPEKGDQQGQLTIAVDWSDGQTAAELAQAARESFVRARHGAEMSAFEDKAAILEAHAGKLRDEVTVLADQVMAAAREKADEGEKGAKPQGDKPAAPRMRAVTRRSLDPLASEEISALRERLAADKPKLSEAESDWQRRLREEQGKLADLKLHFTESHPQVVTQTERVAMLSQPPAELAALRAEIKAIEGDIRTAEMLGGRAASAGGSSFGGSAADPLPATIVQALDKDDVDPALRAQLATAVTKYGDLRSDILMGRIDLDTAQAAFNHRYQVVIPAEAPSKPEKPKPALILIGGLLATLLVAFGVPVLLELRGGVMVERWQVHHLQLPVLAELKLPPHSSE